MKTLLKKEDGQVLVFFALIFVFIMAFAGLVIDLGAAASTKASIQSAADAAALGGAQELLENPGQAVTYAETLAAANGINSDDSVEVYIDDDENTVRVAINRTKPTYLARLVGKSSFDISVDSTATAGYAASVPWIVPFVIPQPIEFNYDHPYVMRMYGGGEYPDEGLRYNKKTGDYEEFSPYNYPNDYKTHPVYKNYPLEGAANVYRTIGSVSLKKDPSNSSQTLATIPAGVQVKYITSRRVGNRNPQTWYNITYNGKTGWARRESFSLNTGTGNIYPYHFDYMNVYIKNNTGFDEYVDWLEFGYHDKFTVNENMYYYAPSSGGKPSWDAFERRVDRDPNTDYTKAKVGDDRVILIPIVEKMMSRSTARKTPMKIIGFTAFYIQSVHKNDYGTNAWFDGRFLENVNVAGDVTIDPNADYGLRVVKLIE